MIVPRTLRMKMFLTFGLLFVVVLLADQAIERFGLPFLSFQGRVTEQRQEVFKALNLTADLKKERLRFWLDERIADSSVVARSPILQSPLVRIERRFHSGIDGGMKRDLLWGEIRADRDYQDIRHHLDVMLNSYNAYDRLDIIDLHSGVVLASTDEREQGAVIFDEDISFTGLSSAYEYSINIWRHPDSGDFHLHIARFIELPGKLSDGLVLLMHIDTSYFLEPFLKAGGGLGETGEALLVNREQKILTPLKYELPDGSRAKPLQYRINAQPAKLAAQGMEGIIAAEDYRGVPVLAAYRHIKVSPEVAWGLVIKRDVAEIYSNYRRENILSMMIIVFGLFFVVGCTFILARNLSAPITHISDAARLIRGGELTARADVKGTVEIEVLAEAFNAMADRIKIYTEQLQEKNEELEAFLYTAAHDLKNPLIGALGFIYLLNKSLAGHLDHNQRYLIDKTTATLQQFERLLTDLLDYSQVRVGPPEEGRSSLESLLERIKVDLWENIRSMDAEIRLHENLPEILMNESRAYQIFSNLVSNSLKFTREGVKPLVEIGMVPRPELPVYGSDRRIPDNHDLFFVTDNGMGIDQIWHDKIFGLFVQVDKKGSHGSGTGLAIVRRIIRQENGKIWIKSTPGSGTTFYFTLPTSP